MKDEKLQFTLTLLYITKQNIIDGVGSSLQTLFESVCASAHPQLRAIPEFILALARAKDPEIKFEIDNDVNRLMDTIADIVCREVEQLTPNFVTKMLINDPDLQTLQLLKPILSRK
jgi:hypothetical protein